MNWIKQNPFLSGLFGGTLVLCGLLSIIATKGASKYQDSKIRFENAFREVTKSEKLQLYPIAQNRQAKIKALDDYNDSIDKLREFHSKFQIDPKVNLSTQEFTGHLKAANEEVVNAFKAAESKLPDDFFMGFNAYRSQLAKSGSTALLDYQLKALKHLLLGMAEARPTELSRIYRKKIVEEDDGIYEPAQDDVAREFSYEIVFKGSEASVRDFINKFGDNESYYYVIRSMRIENEKNTPPRISDAKFEKPAPAGTDLSEPFGVPLFEEVPPAEAGESQAVPEVLPEVAAPEVAVPEVRDASEKPTLIAPPVAAVDSTKILSQVLGDEELQVFIRFDILMFFPTKETTKP